MAYAKGQLNVTKLLSLLEANKSSLYKSENGDDILKININFHEGRLNNGSNVSISLFNPQNKGLNLFFGNANLDYKNLKYAGII